ncbi:ATP-dependent DNA helicase RecG [Geomicrobium sediminis]|nr:ATP-dependent DNA helicase RecG [Geomicrobium sediminis]
MMNTPVSSLKGIGKESAKDLERLGIFFISDLLAHLPYRYENKEAQPVEQLVHDENVTVEGVVIGEARVSFYGRKKNRLNFKMNSGGHVLNVVAFNRAFLKSKLQNEVAITVSGKWNRHRAQITAQSIEVGQVEEKRPYAPIYALSGRLTTRQLTQWTEDALAMTEAFPPERLPEALLERYKLPAIVDTIQQLHRPTDKESLKHARRRYIYEEFLLFQLRMQAYKRSVRQNEQATPLQEDVVKVKAFMETLPFALTQAQKRSLDEIVHDLHQPYRMNRLLQGDVGSGKTVVAAIAMYAVITAGKTTALMVPTEILAEQHYESLQELFRDCDVSIRLLTGSTRKSERKQTIEALEAGQVNVLIGTHALIQPDVPIPNLGLVVTDEQHRFGVNQRRALKEKGSPDVLFMTATPIPRTLAITAFGDMDVSRIDEQPVGRKPVETYWAKHDMFERVITFIEKEIRAGRQAYVICPLIEESEQLDVQNAIDLYEQLQQILPSVSVGLVHGRLSNDEKNGTMERFFSNHVQLLVSTTVVEVGVNVPNATCMLIYDADRFGLAQLHQLRGRVGRGDAQSYCILLSDPTSETGKERMKIMTETTDGFVLAEEDLKLRGPGDLLGKKQSGMPHFRLADPVHDYRALETARQDAQTLIQSDAFWTDAEYEALRNYLSDTGALSGEKLD